MRRWMLGIAFVLCIKPHCVADTQVYKCTKNGVTSFSQTPCSGQLSTIHEVKTYTPSKEEVVRAAKENQARQKEYDKLVKTREMEEARIDRMRRAAAKQAAVKQKQCDNLKMKTDWAKEDYRNAKPKEQEQARTRLRRSEQVYSMSCK